MSEPIPIVSLHAGDKVRLVNILNKDNGEIRKLTAFGIIAGAEIDIIQTFPAHVLKVENTQVALDYELAKQLIVKIIEKKQG